MTSKVWSNYNETSEIEPEVYIIVSKKYATLKELDIDYSVSDLYDILEIIDIENDIESAAHKDAEQESKMNKR